MHCLMRGSNAQFAVINGLLSTRYTTPHNYRFDIPNTPNERTCCTAQHFLLHSRRLFLYQPVSSAFLL